MPYSPWTTVWVLGKTRQRRATSQPFSVAIDLWHCRCACIRHDFCQYTSVVSPVMDFTEGDDPMQRYLAAMLLTVTAVVVLMFLLRHGEAYVVQHPLTEVPVTGRLP